MHNRARNSATTEVNTCHNHAEMLNLLAEITRPETKPLKQAGKTRDTRHGMPRSEVISSYPVQLPIEIHNHHNDHCYIHQSYFMHCKLTKQAPTDRNEIKRRTMEHIDIHDHAMSTAPRKPPAWIKVLLIIISSAQQMKMSLTQTHQRGILKLCIRLEQLQDRGRRMGQSLGANTDQMIAASQSH